MNEDEDALLRKRIAGLEDALKESEARSNALIKHAPTAIYELDYRVPRFITVNEAMCHITGYAREELLSMNPADILDDDSKKLFADRIRRQLAGDEIGETVDFRVRKKDGSYIYVTQNVALSKEKPHTALVIGYDVTERKKAEQTLRESEEKYRTLFNSIDEGFLLVDVIFDEGGRPMDLLYIEANAAATNMLGQDYTGRRLTEISPGYEPHWIELFGGVATTGESVRLERYAELDRRWYDFFVFKVGGPDLRRIGISFRDTTERKLAEQERERLLLDVDEARRRFEAVVENSPVGICAWRGQDLVYVLVNPAYRSIAPGKDFVGKAFADVWPEVADQFVPLLTEVLRTGEPYYAEDVPTQIRRSPGGPLEYAFFNISFVVLPADSSGERGILAIAVETTEQVRARHDVEELARRAEVNLAELEAVIDSMAEGLIVSDLNGNVVTMNPEALRLHGYAGLEDARRHLNEFGDTFELRHVDGAVIPVEEWPLARVLRGESLTGFEVRVRHAVTGREAYWSFSGRLVRNLEGEAVLTVLTVRDVTRQKEAEEALRESERKFALMFDKAPFAAALSKLPDGVIVDVNEAFEKTFGYTKSEAVGRTTLQLNINPDAEGRARLVAELQDSGSARDQELTLNTRSGEARIFSVNLDLVEIGGQRYILNMTQDISRRKRAEAEREQLLASEQEARAQAEAAVRVRDEFMTIAAHELKTPVTSLQGYAQVMLRGLAKRGAVEPTHLARSMERIEEQSKRLARLTDQLLDLSRLEAGKLKLAPESADLASLVENVVDSFRHARPDRAMTLRASPPVLVRVDPIRIEQVLTNLLDNALKFSPREMPVEVVVDAGEPGWARIAVRDYGIGVAAEKREKIFDRYYQAHSERHYGGMGMGLFISRQIVEMHGGTITVEQPESRGTRFVVRLPAHT